MIHKFNTNRSAINENEFVFASFVTNFLFRVICARRKRYLDHYFEYYYVKSPYSMITIHDRLLDLTFCNDNENI